jgi:hypothetical protein
MKFQTAWVSTILMVSATAVAGNSPTAPHSVPALRWGRSRPLREIPGKPPTPRKEADEMRRFFIFPPAQRPTGPAPADPTAQRYFGTDQPNPAGVNVDGTDFANNFCGCVPPDTNGTVGATQYVQWVNTAIQVFDKATGASVLGPEAGNTLWSGFGGACEAHNSGDPIARYDSLAQSWVLMQPVFTTSTDGQYHFCFAVSQTSDATGAWNLYDFGVGSTEFPDYPHLGVWPDGYYLSDNESDGGGSYAFDRSAMLAGLPAAYIYFHTPAPLGGVALPSDWDGDGGAFGLPPPPGSPNYFVKFDCTNCQGNDGWLDIWSFHADFVNPTNSTYNGPVVVNTAPFALLNCVFSGNSSCVPQPGTSDGLDSLGDRLMYRAAYRNFGDHESLLLNHTVNAGGVGQQAGPRWYEVRDPGGAPTIFQQGTYAPDSTWRWMASLAMDISGDIALGYSRSSTSVFPEIDITGRIPSDPPGTLGSELLMQIGMGSQLGSVNRWGDYSSMTVDPTDGCTFWYTTEYYPTTASRDWNTRLASFKYPSCSSPPTGTLTGTVTDAGTGMPVTAARVSLDDGQSAATNASGVYQFALLGGTYSVTATATGYTPQTAGGVSVTVGLTTTQDFALQSCTLPTATVSGGGAFCADSGASAAISAALTGAPPWTVLWSDGVTDRGVLTSPDVRLVSPPRDTVYSVLSVMDDSCTGVGSSSGSASVTVNPLPFGTATGSASICAGGVTPISGSGGVSCTWSPAAGLSDPNSCTPTASPATTTTYVLTVTDANGCSSGGLSFSGLQNSGFETGDLTSWVVDGFNNAPVASNARAHGGTWSALLGNINPSPEPSGNSSLHQAFTVPSSGGMLSFWYWPYTTDSIAFDWQDAYITDGAGGILATIMHVDESDQVWKNKTFDLTPFAGQTVRVKFLVHQDGAGDDTAMYVDDVGVVSPAQATVTILARPAPSLSVLHCLPPNTPGLVASVAGNAGDTYAWTLTGGTITGGQGTNQITFTSGPAAQFMTISIDETSSAGCSGSAGDTMEVNFNDVAPGSPFYGFICSLARAGISAGCGAGNYCPGSAVLRSQMAVFLLVGEHGRGYIPPACTGIFQDVACPGAFTDWIEQLFNEGITNGCSNNPLLYCPGNPVSRAGMAVFLLVAQHGTGYVPPACAGIFTDVACPSPFADWIEQLYSEGITGGCSANPLMYCPANSVTRAQMAVFLTATFNLP